MHSCVQSCLKFLLLTALLPACAFKSSEPKKMEVADVARGGAADTGPTNPAHVRLDWQSESGDNPGGVSRELFHRDGSYIFEMGVPATLPAFVPDALRLTFSFGDRVPLVRSPVIRVRATVEGDEGREYQLGAHIRLNAREAEQIFEVEAKGLRKLLSNQREQVAHLELTLSDAGVGTHFAQVNLALSTPPANLEMKEVDFEHAHESLRMLSSNETDLVLYRVLELSNNSRERIDVHFAKERSGKIQQRFEAFGFEQRSRCECVEFASYRYDDYPVKIYLLPLKESLATDWPALVAESVIEHKSTIARGETALFGLYVEGAQASLFARNGVLHSEPSLGGCVRCRQERVCRPSHIAEVCTWVTVPYHHAPLTGLRGGSVYFSLEDDKIPYRVRFAHSLASDDPETRELHYAVPTSLHYP